MAARYESQNLVGEALKISEGMSIEQIRLYADFLAKEVEMREARMAFETAIESEVSVESRAVASLKEVRGYLGDEALRMSGSEGVLLACYSKQLEGEEWMDTKRLNILLGSFDRKPSNTTKIVEILAKKEWIEVDSEGLHAHKTYRLTRGGEREVRDLLDELRDGDGRERLAVVG